jgi:predicted methyltransferase
MNSLTRIVPWSQQLVCEVLHPGALAVDLTAGRGRDTLAMARAVGPEGQVVAFDVQSAALEQTSELLRGHGFIVRTWPVERVLPVQAGVFLVQACHSAVGRVLRSPVAAIMANLGYLPGGDPQLITRPATTLAAVQESLGLLAPGGRLAVTVYPAHPGGDEESALVDGLLGKLPGDRWQVLSLRAANIGRAPYLLVAERIG